MGVVASEVQRKALVGEGPASQALREEVRELRRRLALQEGDRDPFADLHRLRFKVALSLLSPPLASSSPCVILSSFSYTLLSSWFLYSSRSSLHILSRFS